VLILSDDQAWSDFGFMGSEIIETPNIDSLAEAGFRFSLAFNTASVCRASLRSILTGYFPSQYESRFAGLGRTAGRRASPSQIREIETLPRLLAQRGYVSFQGGKYWEGSFRDGGFSEGLADGRMDSASSLDPLTQAAGGASLELGRETMAPLFEFIDDNRTQPFFVWFAPLLPHRPFDADASYRDRYVSQGLSESTVGYYANIARLDERVGELKAHLERRDLIEQTLIVFLTDNGWEAGGDGIQEQTMGGAQGKFSIQEDGFRTPLIMSWPNTITPGRDDHTLISTVDLFATLLDVAGVSLPSDRWGESFLSLLLGAGDFAGHFAGKRVIGEVDQLRTPPGGSFPFLESAPGSFLRTRSWRYVRVPKRGLEGLYRIKQDVVGPDNLCSSQPETCRGFREEWLAWHSAMAARPPIGPPTR
jgi:uncharacterized sulfatase